MPLGYAFANSLHLAVGRNSLASRARRPSQSPVEEIALEDEAEALASSPEMATSKAPIACAYIVSRYPYVTHTFVQREVLALRERGATSARSR